ncbi:hypothetical protein MKW94_012645 [Papaver nudicaule]|uniref:Sodium/calcium exchanger membrane region domain-containing protein n=1 Tax=Papaver nudicaule TaxID=74823 RepID=A0AA41RR16_PAPNU|nr:hypothetical protein [Papaver nudicaule]
MALTLIKTSAISLTLVSTLIFFLISPSHLHHKKPLKTSLIPHRSLLNSSSSSCSSILEIPLQERCSFSLVHCNGDSNGLFNYSALHFCIFRENPFFTIPILSCILLFQFYFLVKTAQDRFSIVVTKLTKYLDLSPSMGAVTLLALGNGAPDVFASVAAVRGGHARTGLGAILSAGIFVSAFVVGFVTIYAAPFNVDASSFVRDVFFYLIAAFTLFYVYLSAEIYLWQAIGFVGFYAFFVGFVFWMDVVKDDGKVGKGGGGGGGDSLEMNRLLNEDLKGFNKVIDYEKGDEQYGNAEEGDEQYGNAEEEKTGVCGALEKISKIWEFPVSTLLKLTIPQTNPSEWSRFYISANIALCPLALLYSCNSFIPFDHGIIFLLPHTQLPLWSVILFICSILALLHYIFEAEPPESEQIPAVVIAFMMSVFWISTIAGELLDCLAAFGTILELPPALLGLTVLAWGNSVGDLVADVAVAKAGNPAMAMAGCFAGPMFNMLVGLGTGLVIQTVDVYPLAYKIQFHLSIVIAFVFLLLSLMGSLLVITWSRFRVPRFWGFCLVSLYILFTVVSLVIATFSR